MHVHTRHQMPGPWVRSAFSALLPGRAGTGLPLRPLARRAGRGFSLVELMVGITAGLFIVAAAAVLVAGQLGENRRLMLDTQLQQDLRATADIVTRELRRVNAAGNPELLVAHPTRPARVNPATNPMLLAPTASGAHAAATFGYQRELEFGPWGFAFDAAAGVIRTQLGAAGWQELTDRTVTRVTDFSIRIEREPEQLVPCPRLCPSNDTSCWPALQVLNYHVEIAAQARADASITRRIRSAVRARNDWVEFRIPAATFPARPACPD